MTKQTRDSHGRFFSYRRLIRFVLLTITALVLAYTLYRLDAKYNPVEMYNPLIEDSLGGGFTFRFLTPVEAKESVRQALPNMVEVAAERFTKNAQQKNRVMAQLWCLLREESNFGENETCGDSGKSCGILQFREATYNRMRRQMIKAGLVEELGDRFSEWYSIETTAWALVQGYGNEWGPVARSVCK